MAQIFLGSTTMAPWPTPIIQQSFEQVQLEQLAEVSQELDISSFIWLGYSSPLDCLHRALFGDIVTDLSSILNQWKYGAEICLRLKRLRGDSCLLLNLPKLTSVAIDKLISSSQVAGFAEQVSVSSQLDQPVSLPRSADHLALVNLIVAQRRDLINLYFDLEGQADLFDREPEFRLHLPDVSDPAFGEVLLRDWQRQGQQLTQQIKDLSDERDYLFSQLDNQKVENQLLKQHNLECEANLEQASELLLINNKCSAELEKSLEHAEGIIAANVSKVTDTASEFAAILKVTEEDNELLRLRFEQVQEELVNIFQSLQISRSSEQVLVDKVSHLELSLSRLQADYGNLSQECRYLFLHSKLLSSADSTQLNLISNLVRLSLQS